MSAAETLREAAALMRERAQAATPGPWSADAWYVVGQVPGGRPGGEVIAQARNTVGRLTNEAQHRADAAHTAAFASPAVALAVADWLEVAARTADLVQSPKDGTYPPHTTAALAVARVYLGGAS